MLELKEHSQQLDHDDFQNSKSNEPQFDEIHLYSKAPNVNRQIIWQIISEDYPNYSFTQFFEHYDCWLNKQKLSIRQTYTGGDTLFINCVSPYTQVINPTTGKLTKVIVFIATLGASGYTYVEVFEHNDTESALMANVNALNFFGGTPKTITTYQESNFALNPLTFKKGYSEFIEHYNIDFEKTEFSSKRARYNIPVDLQVITRWLLFYINAEGICTLEQLNSLSDYLSSKLNGKKLMFASRENLFEILDKPELLPLPNKPYEFFHIKKIKSGIDQHVNYKNHKYSTPSGHSAYTQTELEVRANAKVVNIYEGENLIATHPRVHTLGGYSTMKLHMSHYLSRDRNLYSKAYFISWANKIGSATTTVIQHLFSVVVYPQKAYLKSLNILHLSKIYNNGFLEKACDIQLKQSPVYDIGQKSIEDSIKSLIKTVQFVERG